MLNLKKALVVGTVLTAFCATAAYAADEQADKPSIKERTNRILHENDQAQPPQGDHHKMGPRHFEDCHHILMTQEEREAMQQRRETWKNMTPEQREEAYQKYIQERIDKAPTAEEKAKLQEMEKRRQEWKKMTPEQRKEACEQRRQENLNKLTDAQRAEVEQFIKDDMAQREAMRARLEKMTPEQRACIRDAHMQHGPRHMGPQGGPGHHFGHGPQGGPPPAPPAPDK